MYNRTRGVPMKQPTAAVLILLLSFLFLPGCTGMKQPPMKIDYYTLEYDAAPVPAAAPLPVVLKIDRFSAAPEYNTDRMVYRDSSFRRATYYYHKWHAYPADLVTFFLSRDLAGSGRFKGVLPPLAGTASTHVLQGSVEEFLEWDEGASWQAVVTVNIVLAGSAEIDAAGRILLQRRFTSREDCADRTPAAVAGAMSRAMARLSAEIGAAVYETLR